MAFDAKEALDRWADKEATVNVWRPGWAGSPHTFDNLADALRFSQAGHVGAIDVNVLVHLDGMDYPLSGENLKAIAALVDP